MDKKKAIINYFPLCFFKLSIGTQILLSIILGALLGIVMRYYPNIFSFVGLTATSFQQLGNLFIKLVKMIALPLIFSCVMSSVISLCHKASTGKTTLLTIVVFLLMTLICVSFGMLFGWFFEPGSGAVFDKESLLSNYNIHQNGIITQQQGNSISAFLLDIVPSNIFISFAESKFLQIIFFSILFSFGIAKVDKKDHIYDGIKTLSKICMEVVQIIMKFAPFGTFGISTWLIATQNLMLLKSLGKLICVDWLAVVFVMYAVYSLIIACLLRLNPVHFWKKLFPAQMIAFLTSSSSAALPSGIKIAQEKIGVSEEKTNFVIPFSAAINSSGGGMYFALMTIFMAQLFDIQLTQSQYITLFIMSALCDLGVAPVPGGSLIMLSNVFLAVGIPIETIGLAFAVDRILDMARSLMNFTGDVYSAFIVDGICKTLDKRQYNKEKKRFFFI